MENQKILTPDFYLQEDVVLLAQKFLGKILYTKINNRITAGRIVETESYRGIDDKACHAYGNRLTPRTETMFEKGGISYIYLCYGMHHLLNIVTNKKNVPHAVLIRALEPLIGIDIMLKRRKKKIFDTTLTSGPGSLSKALGLTKKENGLCFQGPKIWIEDAPEIPFNKILASPRVGVSYAEEDALLPWRFRIKNNRFCSRAK